MFAILYKMGDTMQCENIFCIYFENDACILNEISLDIQGNCRDCIYIDLDDKTLKAEREKILKRFEKQ